MRIKVGSHLFVPRPFTTLVTLALLAGLLSMGRWQLIRADEKRALFDAFARGADATRMIDAGNVELRRYQHVEATGRYDTTRQVLIDNMFDAHGHAGYYVITPFALVTGGWLLVNRGWLPVGAQRAHPPAVDVEGNTRRIHGRTDHLPSPGIHMGAPPALRPPFPVVANFPAHVDLERLLGETCWSPAAEVVLLDPQDAGGYVREWQAPGLTPLRHLAYAVQWFGLALALAVIYVVTNLRRPEARAVQP